MESWNLEMTCICSINDFEEQKYNMPLRSWSAFVWQGYVWFPSYSVTRKKDIHIFFREILIITVKLALSWGKKNFFYELQVTKASLNVTDFL